MVLEGAPSVKHLRDCISALKLQSYSRWELLIVTPKKSPEVSDLVSEMGEGRISYREVALEKPCDLKNFAASQMDGDWVGFVEAEDVLSPAALFLLARSIEQNTVDLIYTNEVKIDQSSRLLSDFLSKPEYSWFDLIHFNYIGHFWVVRKTLFEALDGFKNTAYSDHEFLLRASEKTNYFKLEPTFLYYRREGKQNPSDKSAQASIVKEHLIRKKFSAEVGVTHRGNQSFIRVKPKVAKPRSHLLSVVICFRDKAELTNKCLKSLARQVGEVPVEVILVNNQSSAEEINRVEEAMKRLSLSIKLVSYGHPFNYAEMNNWAVRNFSRGDVLLFLNNDVSLNSHACLDEWVAWAMQGWAGTVGILLSHPDGKIQHGGLRARWGNINGMFMLDHVRSEKDFVFESREVFGSTFAACMSKKTTFESVGGLRSLDYPNAFSDVAYNFECKKRGLRNLYLGSIEGTHLESASRGLNYEYWEECGIEKEYPKIIQEMLRFDLGYDRIPNPNTKLSLKQFVRSGVAASLSKRLGRWKNLETWLRRSTRLSALLTHHR